MDIHESDATMREAHAAIGGFIARCSLLDYRVSQFMARWFCAHEKQKFLSYTLKAMPFAEKRQVIEERLSKWHDDPAALRTTMAQIAAVLECRNLVASGVLSRRSSGALCVKSFSAARFLLKDGAIDVLDMAEVDESSERATELAHHRAGHGTSRQCGLSHRRSTARGVCVETDERRIAIRVHRARRGARFGREVEAPNRHPSAGARRRADQFDHDSGGDAGPSAISRRCSLLAWPAASTSITASACSARTGSSASPESPSAMPR